MTTGPITIRPITPLIGAEIEGIDLSQPLDNATLSDLHQAWMRHQVLFFRDQQLDPASLQALGRQLGTLHVHPQGDMEGFEGILKIHTDHNSKTYAGRKWHADVTCDTEPPTGSILHLHDVPESGGDTLFANMVAAHDALSAPMQSFLAGLSAVHTSERNFSRYFGTRIDETRDGGFPEATHPVVAAHPKTGAKSLYVNEIFTSHIVELEPEEGSVLLEFLYQHINQPRFQCRFQWHKNSVAMWDNRATQHMAMFDYWPHTRAGHRVTIKGARPQAA